MPHAAAPAAPSTSQRLVPPRRAAVAFADIVGYTILMSEDPGRTHARWMELLHGTLRPLARARGSRIVKSTGDGMLADFDKMTDALAWARAVHAHVAATDRPDLPPIAFRIALAFGEIDATDDDLYGPCVNIAARLQEHAPPGGIALTAEARAELGAPPPLEPLGLLSLRNIATPVEAFVGMPAAAPRVPYRRPPTGMPSVAVMPFELPQGSNDQYLATGLIEDIVLSLGALSDLSVTARSATLSWGAGRHDPAMIGRVLGVRYVLSGALRRAPGRMRLAVALRETAEGDSVWSDRYDIASDDLFDVQDEIVTRVVGGLAPGIRSAELRRALRAKPGSLTAYDHTLRGMHELDALRGASFAQARQQFDDAIATDPAYAAPVAWAARWHSFAYSQGWSRDPARDRDLWGATAARAIALDPANAMAHVMAGHFRARVLHDPQGALADYDRALSRNPNYAPALSLKSAALSYLGRGPEALALGERALSLAPRGPERFYYLCFVGMAHLACGDNDTAAQWLRQTIAENPDLNAAHRFLIAALHGAGRADEARAAAAVLRANEPEFRVSAYAGGRQPFRDAALAAQLIGALRAAGLPD